MFRELVRKKQQLTEEEAVSLLKNEKRGVLSVLDDDGYPYGIPLNHFYNEEDGKLYFHSGKAGHKIDALRRCPKVSYCVLDGGADGRFAWSKYFRSVIVFGHVEMIEDKETIYSISAKLSRKFTNDEDYIDQELKNSGPSTLMFALVPEHICGKLVHEA